MVAVYTPWVVSIFFEGIIPEKVYPKRDLLGSMEGGSA